jgi:chromosome segregation ATPase
VKILKNYTEQLKNSARIKAALDKLPEAEKKKREVFDDASENMQNAYLSEKMFHKNENDAIRENAAGPSAYRAWKAKLAKLDKEIAQYNGIIDTLTAENQRLSDEAAALGEGGGGEELQLVLVPRRETIDNDVALRALIAFDSIYR